MRTILILLSIATSALSQGLYFGSSVVTTTELADTFTIGGDADLNTHTTTTGGYAWVKAGQTITDVASSGVARDDSTSSGPSYVVNHTMSSADYTVQCDVSYPNLVDGEEADVAGRVTSQTAGACTAYFIAWFPDASQANLYKVVNGTPTQLGSNFSTTGTTQTLKLVMKGTTISAYCNGSLIASVTDSAISAAGNVGIGAGFRGARVGSNGANHITYDNLLVTVP